MTSPRTRKRGLRLLLVATGLAAAAFGYRHYRLSKAPEPRWDNPG